MNRIIRFCILLVSIHVYAQSHDDPVSLIGKGPEYIHDAWGSPERIYSQRAEKPEWDTVLFTRQGCTLFWVAGFVWQIRFDHTFQGSWREIKIGVPYPVLDGILGTPWLVMDTMRVYSLSEYEYPIQVRCFFENDTLNDVYIYRSEY